MKAAQIKSYGSVDKIDIVKTDKPVPGDGQVLVAVKAAGLNPFDITLREGHISKDGKLAKPLTLGGDFAGVVDAVGSNVTGFKPGDKVYGFALTLAGGSGALAEFAVVPTKRLAMMPKDIDFKQAASLPLVGSSAVQAVYDHIQLKADEKLFIHGGNGGIGTIAIQIAKHIGAYVAASTRGNTADALKTLGADEVINTGENDFSSVLVDFNAVLNLVRGEDFDKFIAVLSPGGVIVSLTGKPDDYDDEGSDVKIVAQGTDTNTKHLEKLRELTDKGAVRPVVAATFPLENIRGAFQKLEAGGFIGKVVVTIP